MGSGCAAYTHISYHISPNKTWIFKTHLFFFFIFSPLMFGLKGNNSLVLRKRTDLTSFTLRAVLNSQRLISLSSPAMLSNCLVTHSSQRASSSTLMMQDTPLQPEETSTTFDPCECLIQRLALLNHQFGHFLLHHSSWITFWCLAETKVVFLAEIKQLNPNKEHQTDKSLFRKESKLHFSSAHSNICYIYFHNSSVF